MPNLPDNALADERPRFHVEGQISTLGRRWLIWDGERHSARFQNIADRTDADNICAELNALNTLRRSPAGGEGARTFKLGDRVTKKSGSQWTGKIVGCYSTVLTPEGYAVESDSEIGSVQIYPAAALRPCASPSPEPAPTDMMDRGKG